MRLSIVRVEFIKLAMENKPLNLGQGFPDYGCPQHVTQGLADVMADKNLLLNQYTSGYVSHQYPSTPADT